jgi:hypothetical protein
MAHCSPTRQIARVIIRFLGLPLSRVTREGIRAIRKQNSVSTIFGRAVFGSVSFDVSERSVGGCWAAHAQVKGESVANAAHAHTTSTSTFK